MRLFVEGFAPEVFVELSLVSQRFLLICQALNSLKLFP